MSRLGHYGRFTSHLFAGLLALSLTSWAVPRPAQAQDAPTRAAARAAFQGGVAAYDAGHYQAALEHFQEAYRLLPNPTVRVNMASCYEQLDLPLQAIDHFERFLVEPATTRLGIRCVRCARRCVACTLAWVRSSCAWSRTARRWSSITATADVHRSSTPSR